jgi:hypothetical protein
VDSGLEGMTHTTTLGKRASLTALKLRRATQPQQIDNASLPAGAPMYFYCKSCGHLADTKPELYTDPVKQLCGECQAMKDCGWLE